MTAVRSHQRAPHPLPTAPHLRHPRPRWNATADPPRPSPWSVRGTIKRWPQTIRVFIWSHVESYWVIWIKILMVNDLDSYCVMWIQSDSNWFHSDSYGFVHVYGGTYSPSKFIATINRKEPGFIWLWVKFEQLQHVVQMTSTWQTANWSIMHLDPTICWKIRLATLE